MLRMLVALSILALPLGPSPAAAECCAASCAAFSPTPRAVTINGAPYVRTVVSVECGTGVDAITVRGRLRMDGDVVDAEAKTCRGNGDVYVCRVALKKRNAPGIQTWTSVAWGSYARWGTWHEVPRDRSGKLTA